jgi:hypothetical protein
MAQTSALDSAPPPKPHSESDLPSFLNYVTALLEQQSTNSGLLSPTTTISPHLRRASSIAEPTTSKEAIDLAIIRSNQSSTKKSLSTRFSISRSSRPVATILLSRTAYRLGETIHLVIDFSSNTNSNSTSPQPTADHSSKHSTDAPTPVSSLDSHIPVYALLVTLETLETIDPAIAMRSPQSISRYTRKIHAQFAESTHFARRISTGLAVPPVATPEFATSGVGLEWRVRVEFVTPRLWVGERKGGSGPGGREVGDDENGKHGEDDDDEDDEKKELVEEEEEEDEWPEKEWSDLLEEVAADDRGTVFHGVENLDVETFEVSIPVRVYGAIVGGKGEWDKGDLVI